MNDSRSTGESGTNGPQAPPSGYLYVMPEQRESDGITLAEVFSIAFGSWKLIAIVGMLCGIAAGAGSYLIKPSYRAATVIFPVKQGGGASALRSQLGGIAALAGIDVGSAGRDKEQALATLKSTGFVRDFIIAENLLPVMYPERWDPVAKAWRAGEKPPSLELAVQRFITGIRTITEEQRTGIITMSIEWYSPQTAADWANKMVAAVNERMREDAKHNADRSIEFLNQELAKTSVVELSYAIYRLVEEQVNNAMLANVQHEYAFRVIDPAVAPEQRSSPRRTMMALVGGVLGGFLGVIVVFVRRAARRSGASSGPASQNAPNMR